MRVFAVPEDLTPAIGALFQATCKILQGAARARLRGAGGIGAVPKTYALSRRALFERVFAVPEDLVRSLAPPGLEGAEAAVRDRLRIRRVLDLGLGTGPNLQYYAAQPWVRWVWPPCKSRLSSRTCACPLP